MNQSGGNFQLQFYIRLTQIIGRTFTELQELLTNELKRQQHQAANLESTFPANNQILPIVSSQPLLQNQDNLESKKSNQQDNNQQNILNHQIKQDIKAKPKKAKPLKVSKFERKKKKILKRKKLVIKKTNMEKLKVQIKLKKDKTIKSKRNALELGKPYPPLNAFMLFLKQNKHEIMKKKPQLSPSEVSKYASTLWNDFSESEKEIYLKIYRKNHEQYLEELRAFQQRQEKQKFRNMPKVKFNQNSQSNEKERSESSYSMNDEKSKQNGGLRLRDNLRSRSQRRKQASGEIICLESEVEEVQNNHLPEQL